MPTKETLDVSVLREGLTPRSLAPSRANGRVNITQAIVQYVYLVSPFYLNQYPEPIEMTIQQYEHEHTAFQFLWCYPVCHEF
jgi:hypothetical protein